MLLRDALICSGASSEGTAVSAVGASEVWRGMRGPHDPGVDLVSLSRAHRCSDRQDTTTRGNGRAAVTPYLSQWHPTVASASGESWGRLARIHAPACIVRTVTAREASRTTGC